MTEASSQSWHDYENPPVVEVVCGILFSPIERLLAPHLGLLWERFRTEYPNCQEVPPLMPLIERFDRPPEPKIEITDKPPLPRVWFLSADENRLIQVQRDRFLHNWKKMRPEDEYPRYRNVIRVFRNHLSLLESFLAETDLGTIQPTQCEMTYLNHIPQGEGWDSINGIGRVFPDFAWHARQERFLPSPDAFNWRTIFLLPNNEGRLHVAMQTATRNIDGHPLLVLELTARGIGADTSPEGMWAWFDMAREWIVRGFTDLTGSEVQKDIWRRTK